MHLDGNILVRNRLQTGKIHLRYDLLVDEDRGLLLDKSVHANLLVLEGKGGVEKAALKDDTLLQSSLEGSVDGLLGQGNNGLGKGSDLGSSLDSLIHELAGRHNAGDKAGTFGLLSRDHTASQGPVHGLGLANSAGEALGASATRHGAESDLGLAELGGLASDDEVAHHGELAATAEGIAVHGSNNRLLNTGHIVPEGEHVHLVGIDVVLGGHLLDIGTSSECLGGTSDNNRANRGVLVKLLELCIELLDESIAKSVQSLGAVQSDDANAILDL